ncbi:MAG: hypothetical protein ACFE8A_09045 [Candidatus Hodarchaeota archaeon]
MPMEKEDIYWIVGLIMILTGIGLLIWGITYIAWGGVVAQAEAGLAQYGYTGVSGAAMVAGGVVLLIIGIVLMVIGLYLVYTYKIKAEK